MKIDTNDLVKGHSDFKVKCLTFGLYTQVSDSGPLGPLVFVSIKHDVLLIEIVIILFNACYQISAFKCRAHPFLYISVFAFIILMVSSSDC